MARSIAQCTHVNASLAKFSIAIVEVNITVCNAAFPTAAGLAAPYTNPKTFHAMPCHAMRSVLHWLSCLKPSDL